MSNINETKGPNKKIRTKYDILFNFYGANNAKVVQKEKDTTLLQKKRKNSDEELFKKKEEIDENNSKMSNINNNEENDIKGVNKNSKLKITFYDSFFRKKEDNQMDDKENKENENVSTDDKMNIEENEKIEDLSKYTNTEKNESNKIDDLVEYTNAEKKTNNENEDLREGQKMLYDEKEEREEKEESNNALNSNASFNENQEVNISQIRQKKEKPARNNNRSNNIGNKNKKKKVNNLPQKSKEEPSNSNTKASEEPNKKPLENNLDPLTTKELFNNPHDSLPDFLRPENIRDKNGNKPDSPDYDCNTLYVPMEFLKQQSDAMIQFWEFKKEHFDKVIFFKVGKFYEMFYDDAIICNQLLDIKWMGDDPKKLHVGFPEVVLESKASVLVEAGFKIAIVEQTETPKQLKERLKSDRSSEKAVKRKLCGVLTKGTYFKYEEDMNNSSRDNPNKKVSFANTSKNKFCIALFKYEKEINISKDDIQLSQNLNGSPISTIPNLIWGICIFDITTLHFYLGKIEEEPPKFTPKTQTSQKNESNYANIKSLLYNIAPEEIICVSKNIPEIMISFIKGLSIK